MFKPLKHRFPFPKEDLLGEDDQQKDFSEKTMFDAAQDRWPFPIPDTELYPEYTWPKSLCPAAPDCKVSDDFQDLSPAKECLPALRYGCPLYLTHFSEHQDFGECLSIPIFEIGQIESKDYTEQDLDMMIKNFGKLQKSHRPPLVVLGHDEDQELLKKSGLPSAGWVSKIWRTGKKMFADFKEVPQQVATAIKNKAYRFPSVEIYKNFAFNGQEFGAVLRRVALLGADIPRIKSLDDIVARYEESNTGDDDKNIGSLCLPVIQAETYGEDESESLWLGGNYMKKITVPIKDLSGKFKAGEEILDSKGKAVGKLEEMADDSLVITLTAKGDNLEGEISGKDSDASATIGEPEVHNEEAEIEIYELEGTFTEGEPFTVKDTGISGVVKNAEASKLIVLVTPEMMEELKKAGQIIVGQKSNATAKVGKYPYPSPEAKAEAEKKAEAERKSASQKKEGDGTVLKQLQEQMATIATELATVKQENQDLKKLSEKQGELITQTEKERSEEKKDLHFRDIDTWCEDLKRKGLAPAVVDELGLVNYARLLDYRNLFQFAEEGDKQTPWEAFSELMTNMVKKYEEGDLFIPLKNLKKNAETDEPVLVGIDPDAAKLDREVTKYAEDHQVNGKPMDYPDALQAVTAAKEQK